MDGDGGGDVLCASRYGRGKIVALRGSDGAMLWAQDGFREYSSVVVGDADDDGEVEVIALTPEGKLRALNADGTIKWTGIGDAALREDPSYDPLALADLDGDGSAEIVTIMGIFSGTTGAQVHAFFPTLLPYGSEIALADTDLDGHTEVFYDYASWGSDGAQRWLVSETGVPIAEKAWSVPVVLNADADPEAEVAWVDRANVLIVDTDGAILWRANTEEATNPPALACASDLDADGIDELVIETPSALIAFRADGSVLWQNAVDEAQTRGMTGCSFFDFDQDGRLELLYADEHTIYVLDAGSGVTLFSLPRESATAWDLPIVADLNGDGTAEIVIGVAGSTRLEDPIVTAYRHPGGNWPPAPPIWGSATWSGTTLWADGEVRSEPSRPWQDPGFWRGQVSGPLGGRDLAVSIEDACVSSCDDAVGSIALAVQVANHGPQDLRAGALLTVATGAGTVLQTLTLDSIAVGWTSPIQVNVRVVDAREGLVLSVESDCSTLDDSVAWALDVCTGP